MAGGAAPSDGPAVVEDDGLASKLTGFKSKSIYLGERGGCPGEAVCHCGVKETVKAVMEEGSCCCGCSTLKGHRSLADKSWAMSCPSVLLLEMQARMVAHNCVLR